MSTNDVPGAVAGHADVLAMGCWAEHADGSLIFVKGTERDQVVYEIFDMAEHPPISYTDAMAERDFKRQFSWPPAGVSADKWTWHDKTAFPWDRVMQGITRPRPREATAEAQLSAARRVAESLKLRAQRLTEESVSHMREETRRRVVGIIDTIKDAVQNLLR